MNRTGTIQVYGERSEREILLDGGPLVVVGVFREDGVRVPNLYKVYHKGTGLCIGPYYASLPLAAKDMKKALALPNVWGQPLEWVRRQKWLREWIDKNMGAPEDLVGGTWAKEDV